MGRNYMHIVAFILAIGIVQECPGQPKPEVELSKNTFFVGVPIWITVSVRNPGSRTVVALFDGIEDVEVKDSFGRSIPRGGFVEYSGANRRILPPGSKVGYTFDLAMWFLGSEPGGHFSGGGYLSPGIYTVRFGVAEIDTVTKVTSALYYNEPLKFEVKRPEGKVREVYLQMLGADSAQAKEDLQRAIKMRVDLAHRYPQSVYAPYLLWKAAGTNEYLLGKHDKALLLYHQTLTQYPSSQEAVQAVTGIALCYLNSSKEDEAVAEMRKIVKLYPGSLIAERAKEILGENVRNVSKVEDFPPLPSYKNKK